MGKLTRIVSINKDMVQKLKSVGVTTLEKLLARASNPIGRKSISAEAKIPEKDLLKWAHQADMFRIKGIAGFKSELLLAVGVKNLSDLSKQNPDKLFQVMTDYNEKKHLVQRVPGLIQVKRWVSTAKRLTPLVK